MSFSIEDEQLFLKYNIKNIKDNAKIKRFDSEPVFNNTYLKPK